MKKKSKIKKLETLDDFIKFYQKIPANKWLIMYYHESGKRCAIGHLLERDNVTCEDYSPSYRRLRELIDRSISIINDCYQDEDIKLGKTPKTRVINYLKQVKKGTMK